MSPRAARSGFRASAAMARPMVLELESLGVELDPLLSRVGLSREKLDDPDTRLPFESLLALGAAAVEVTGDPAFGLHLAEHYRPNAFGVLDYLAHSSKTLGEAIRHLCRYNRLLQDAAETLLEPQGDRVLLWQRALGGIVLPPGLNENSMANLVVVGRELLGKELVPIEVMFTHDAPPYAAEHARIFRTRVRFRAECDGIVLPAALLDAPLPRADAGLAAILERHAQKLLEQTPRVALFGHRVREFVAAELKDGAPKATHAAEKLQMSERTLRRRLREEGTSWEEVVDDLRRALSERYLGEPGLGVEDVAIMLGYSEVGAFRRAFRRWHGTSPAAFRKERRGITA